MIELTYKRAGCLDLRSFKDPEELYDWLYRQVYLIGEPVEVIMLKRLGA